MMVRRYVVKEMPEAVLLIRKELGKNAVILSTKKIVQKKWLGVWRSRRIEVLAAVGDDIPVKVNISQAEGNGYNGRKTFADGRLQSTDFPSSGTHLNGEIRMAHAETAATGPESIAQEPENATQTSRPFHSQDLTELRKELLDVKQLIHSALAEVQSTEPSWVLPLRSALMEQGIEGAAADKLIAACLEDEVFHGDNGLTGTAVAPTDMAHRLATVLKSMVLAVTEVQPISPASRIVAFIGPTGVGKTTTIAKLAALQVLGGQKKVGLLTTDTFRIAAVEQLKTYANILNIPMEVIYQDSDVSVALERLADRDLILVDTAGRNFRIDSYVEALRSLFQQIPIDETFLVLSVTSKSKDLIDIAESFGSLPDHKLLFTKMDETSSFGAVLNLLLHDSKTLSYWTTGQNVPDDIEIVTPDKLVDLWTRGLTGR